MPRSIFMTVVFLFSSLAAAQSGAPATLKESIHRAFRNNPITNSNKKIIEAEEIGLEALKQAQLPSIVTSASQGQNYGATGTSKDRSLFIGLSVNLYRGGADQYRLEAAEAQLAAQKARIESTDPLLPNTNGQLANQVYAAFLEISIYEESIEFAKEATRLLQRALPFYGPDGQTQIQTQLTDLEDSEKKDFALKMGAQKEFYFNVLENPSEEIQALNEIRLSLVVPSSKEEAVRVGLKNSPTILASQFEKEAARLRYEANKRQNNSPSIDFSVGRSHGHSQDPSSIRSSSASTRASVSLNYQWGIANGTRLQGELKRLEATDLILEGEVRKIRHKIETLFDDLISYENFISNFDQRMRSERAALEQLLIKLENRQPVDIQVLLDKYGAYMGAKSNWINYQINAVETRFSLQQALGTLFENLDMSPQLIESYSVQKMAR